MSWNAGDGLAELLPLLGVVEGRLVAGPGGAGGAEEDAEAGLVEARQRAPHADHAGEHGRVGEPHVVEHQLGGHRRPQRELAVDVVGGEPGRVGGDDEAADRPVVGRAAQTMATSARPPLVIHIFVPLRTQSSPSRRARVRMRAGSLPESGSVRPKQPMASPAAMAGQPLLLLLLGAELPDREHGQRALDGHEAAGAAVARLHLHAGQAVGDRGGAGAAVALEVHAEQPEGRHLLGHLDREGARLEPLGDVGEHPVVDEPAHGVAQQALLVVQQAVEGQEVERIALPGRSGVGSGVVLMWGDLVVRMMRPIVPHRATRERGR